jgi:hypothetical protein
MDASNKSVRGPAEELFDSAIKVVAVWGTAVMVGEGINRLLMEILPRGWRMGISLIAVLVVASALMQGCGLWPRFRDVFFAWRYPIAILLAVYAGYQWQASDYPKSREGRLNEAARWACAKIPSCQSAALEYLSDKSWDD